MSSARILRGVATRPDERRLEAWEALLRTHRALLRQLEQELKDERDLPLAWYELLLHLVRAPDGRLRMHELAQSLLLTPSGLTRLADRLECTGLIRRESCPTDRRGAFAILTPEGRARLRRAAPTHLRAIDEHFGRYLSDDEAGQLVRVFARVLAALGDGDHAC
jgi:DNA-binding MarR family transcriptional regulator